MPRTSVRLIDADGAAIVSESDARILLGVGRDALRSLDGVLDPIVEPLGTSGTRHRRFYRLSALEMLAEQKSQVLRARLDYLCSRAWSEHDETGIVSPEGVRAIYARDRVAEAEAERARTGTKVPLAVVAVPRTRRSAR